VTGLRRGILRRDLALVERAAQCRRAACRRGPQTEAIEANSIAATIAPSARGPVERRAAVAATHDRRMAISPSKPGSLGASLWRIEGC